MPIDKVALEVTHVDQIETYKSGKKANIGLCHRISNQVAAGAQPILKPVECVEQRYDGLFVGRLGRREARLVDTVIDGLIILCVLTTLQPFLTTASNADQIMAVGIDRKFAYDENGKRQALAPGRDEVVFSSLTSPTEPKLLGSINLENSIVDM